MVFFVRRSKPALRIGDTGICFGSCFLSSGERGCAGVPRIIPQIPAQNLRGCLRAGRDHHGAQKSGRAGTIGHAYLFTGTRGTGKTTCAKIFAKAVNCLSPRGGEPCGECEICRGLEEGSILDVVEIDAASNTGIDDIRALREEAVYTPTNCRYKVYIIDEVHMLSNSAFNALLKIMEEPPAHVIFILATTEIQKVPATVLSRCQRYDFGRIQQPRSSAAASRWSPSRSGSSSPPAAAELIAQLADGALRDALSILDTCASAQRDGR